MPVALPKLGPRWHPLTTLAAFALLFSVIAVKLAPEGLAIILGLLIYVVRPSFAQLKPQLPPANPVIWLCVSFAAWTLLSAMWASDPMGALQKGAWVLLLVAVTAGIVSCLPRVDPRTLWFFGRDLVHPLILAAAGLAFELAFDFPLTGLVLSFIPAEYWQSNYVMPRGESVVVAKSWLARQISMVSLLFWPMLLIAAERTPSRIARITMVTLAVLTVLAIFLSAKEAAKLALLIGAVTWVIAWYFERTAFFLATMTWSIAAMLIVPIMVLLTPVELNRQAWIPESGRARIEIWQRMSQHVIERPVLGIGANSTFAEEVRRVERLKAERELGQRNPQANAQRRKEEQFAQYARTHPHNAFLLVWYELGAVGAAIFLLIGLALLREIRRLPPLVRTFGLATMASGTVLASLTHSLWQEWFLSGFAWCLIIFATGLTMHRARPALAAVPEEGTEPRALPT